MQIASSSNIVTITGNIKTVKDFQEIKSLLESVVSKYKDLTLHIQDSISITSSVIGYLNKLVLKDNINLKMKIGNAQLLELIQELHLTTTFKATKA